MKRKLNFIAALASLSLTNSFAQNHPTNGLVEYFSFDSTIIGSQGTTMITGVDNINNYANYVVDNNRDAYYISNNNNRLKSDTIVANYPLGDSEFTVCFWLKLNSSGIASVFNYYGYDFTNDVSGVYMTYDAGQLYFGKVIDNQDYIGTGFAYPWSTASNWHHIALVHSTGSTTIFVDGNSIGTDNAFVFNTQQFNNSKLKMGWSPGGGDYGDYLIDEFLIYNRTLTNNELNSLSENTSSIKEDENQFLTCFPIPATDQLQVTFSNESKSIFSLYSSDNREVMTGELNTGQNTINIQELAAGTYFLKTTINGSLVTKKIVKQ